MLRSLVIAVLLALPGCGSTSSAETLPASPPDLRARGPGPVAVGGTSWLEISDLHTDAPLRGYAVRGEGLDVLAAPDGVVRFRATALGSGSLVFSKDTFADFAKVPVQVVQPTGVQVRGLWVPYAQPLACLAGTNVSLTMELVSHEGPVADDSATLASLGVHVVLAAPIVSKDFAKASFTVMCGLGAGSVGFVSGAQTFGVNFPGLPAADDVELAKDSPDHDPARFGTAFCFEAHSGGTLLLTDEWKFSSPALAPGPTRDTDPPNCVWLYSQVPGPSTVTVTVGEYVETLTVQGLLGG